MPLWEITSACWRTAIRTYVANVAASFAVVLTSAGSTRSSRMVASGATACTSSVSSTSSRPARHGRPDDLDPCRGQAEPAVDVRHVLPDVGGRRKGLRRSRFGHLYHRHRDAAAVDPVIQQRLDAVGDPELPGCVTRLGAQAVSR